MKLKNTFRNKWRVFTSIIGISFCMALILTCLSLKDSINNFVGSITENQHRYDIYMTLNPKANDYDIDKIDSLEKVLETQYSMNTNAVIKLDKMYETVNVNVSEDNVDLKLLGTYDAGTELPLDGIVIEDEFIAILSTFVFANIVNVIIGKMMKKIDMLGALKSVE